MDHTGFMALHPTWCRVRNCECGMKSDRSLRIPHFRLPSSSNGRRLTMNALRCILRILAASEASNRRHDASTHKTCRGEAPTTCSHLATQRCPRTPQEPCNLLSRLVRTGTRWRDGMVPPPAVGCHRQPMQRGRISVLLDGTTRLRVWDRCIAPPKAGQQQVVRWR